MGATQVTLSEALEPEYAVILFRYTLEELLISEELKTLVAIPFTKTLTLNTA